MSEPKEWNYQSPDSNGFHKVVTPLNSVCKQVHAFRLNLKTGENFSLTNDDLELNGVVIEGMAEIIFENEIISLGKYDSFYLPARKEILIKSNSDSIIFIGGANYEGKGEFFCRKFDLNCSDLNIRQVHGEPPYRRDVFMTVGPSDNASRLICGITIGDPGKWTSWPPHQHTNDLEEVYCYFNLNKPEFALHLCSRHSGIIEYVHPVSTGNFVIIPEAIIRLLPCRELKAAISGSWLLIRMKAEGMTLQSTIRLFN
jgi:5-deoxy-glucuronate isomerase